MLLYLESLFRVVVVMIGLTIIVNSKKINIFDVLSTISISVVCYIVGLAMPSFEGIVMIPLVFIYLLLKKETAIKSVFFSIGIMLIVILSEFLVNLLIDAIFVLEVSVFELGENDFPVFAGMTVAVLVFVILFTKIVSLFRNKHETINHRIKLFEIFSVLLALSVFVITLFGIRFARAKDDLLSFSIFFVCYFALIISIGTMYTFTKKDMILRGKEEEQENLKRYTKELEVLCDELHRVMHENNNIMLTMAHYIETDNMPELEAYFNDKILEYKKRHVLDEKNLIALSNITQPEIKSLIYCKLIQANEKRLNPILDVHEDLSITEADIVDLSSMVGILIDNAIQGAQKCKEPELRIGLILKNDSKMIVVQNSCPEDMPNIQQLFGGKSSTKNKTGTGHGLTNLQKIIEKYPKFYLNTEIQDNLITQCIVIEE